MSDRINFLTASGFALSYRNVLLIFVGWVVLLFAVYGYFYAQVRISQYDKEILEERIRVLERRHGTLEQLAEVTETEEHTSEVLMGLTQIFAVTPQWSEALRLLGKATSPAVTIRSFRSSGESVAAKSIAISGKAESAGDVAEFVSVLSSMPLYRAVRLRQASLDEGGGSKFEISAEVSFHEENN